MADPTAYRHIIMRSAELRAEERPPINHLAARHGSFLVADALREMTDKQLAEQSAWLQREHDRYLAQPPDGKPYGNRYAAFRMTVTDSSVWAELRRRRDPLLG